MTDEIDKEIYERYLYFLMNNSLRFLDENVNG